MAGLQVENALVLRIGQNGHNLASGPFSVDDARTAVLRRPEGGARVATAEEAVEWEATCPPCSAAVEQIRRVSR